MRKLNTKCLVVGCSYTLILNGLKTLCRYMGGNTFLPNGSSKAIKMFSEYNVYSRWCD